MRTIFITSILAVCLTLGGVFAFTQLAADTDAGTNWQYELVYYWEAEEIIEGLPASCMVNLEHFADSEHVAVTYACP